MVRSATGGQEDRINPKAFDAFRQISQGGTRRPDQALYDRRAFGELRNEGHVPLMVESGRGRLRRSDGLYGLAGPSVLVVGARLLRA
jgi:hypothetical protein